MNDFMVYALNKELEPAPRLFLTADSAGEAATEYVRQVCPKYSGDAVAVRVHEVSPDYRGFAVRTMLMAVPAWEV